MITADDDTKTITKLSLESGVSITAIEKVFEALQSHVVLDYADKSNRINIPYIGNIKIKYLKDIETSNGREADLDVFFSPNAQLRKIIGQVHDIEVNGEDPKNFDVFQNIRKTIRKDFKTKLSEISD